MENKPLVSIIIPVFNGANYMRQAIDSALLQTYPNIEIIVVNDGSEDNGETEKIALSYGDKIRYIAKENGGSSSALNTGIRHMRGEFFSWLSHDDVYTPTRVARFMEEMEGKDTEKTVVVCGFSLMNEQSAEIFYPKKVRVGTFNAEQMLQNILKGFTINGCGVFLSAKLIEKAGFFEESFRYVNDMDYWYRLINLGASFVCIEDRLVKMRVHSLQVSVTSRDLYHVENEKLLLQCAMDALDQKKYTLCKLYAAQCAYFRYEKNVEKLRTRIREIPEVSTVKWELRFMKERLRGIVKRGAKRLYRLLIWKR